MSIESFVDSKIETCIAMAESLAEWSMESCGVSFNELAFILSTYSPEALSELEAAINRETHGRLIYEFVSSYREGTVRDLLLCLGSFPENIECRVADAMIIGMKDHFSVVSLAELDDEEAVLLRSLLLVGHATLDVVDPDRDMLEPNPLPDDLSELVEAHRDRAQEIAEIVSSSMTVDTEVIKSELKV